MKRIMASITYEKTYYGVKSNEKNVCNPVFITDSLDEIRKYVKDNASRLEFRYCDRSWIRVLAPMVARSLHKAEYYVTVKDLRVIKRANNLGYKDRFDLLDYLPKRKEKVSDIRRKKRRERESAEREKLLTAHRLRARIDALVKEIDGLSDVEVKSVSTSVFAEMSRMRKARNDDEVRFLIVVHLARFTQS